MIYKIKKMDEICSNHVALATDTYLKMIKDCQSSQDYLATFRPVNRNGRKWTHIYISGVTYSAFERDIPVDPTSPISHGIAPSYAAFLGPYLSVSASRYSATSKRFCFIPKKGMRFLFKDIITQPALIVTNPYICYIDTDCDEDIALMAIAFEAAHPGMPSP